MERTHTCQNLQETNKQKGSEQTKIGVCFYCRKPVHQGQNRPNKRQQILSAAASIQQNDMQAEVCYPAKIVSAAQPI